MTSLDPTQRRARFRFLALATCTLVLLSLLAFCYRLALTPDQVIANRLTQALTRTEGIEAAHATLATRYKVSSVGIGGPWGGPWGPRPPFGVPPDYPCFTLLVGEYGFMLTTSVEALVVYRPDGRLDRVLIRRTVDAP